MSVVGALICTLPSLPFTSEEALNTWFTWAASCRNTSALTRMSPPWPFWVLALRAAVQGDDVRCC